VDAPSTRPDAPSTRPVAPSTRPDAPSTRLFGASGRWGGGGGWSVLARPVAGDWGRSGLRGPDTGPTQPEPPTAACSEADFGPIRVYRSTTHVPPQPIPEPIDFGGTAPATIP